MHHDAQEAEAEEGPELAGPLAEVSMGAFRKGELGSKGLLMGEMPMGSRQTKGRRVLPMGQQGLLGRAGHLPV